MYEEGINIFIPWCVYVTSESGVGERGGEGDGGEGGGDRPRRLRLVFV